MSKYIPRLLEDYNKRIKPSLSKDLGISNQMRVPKILKISLNIGFGQAKLNENQLKAAVEELTSIAGQKAVITKAKKSEAGFKLREGYPIGARVTLRGDRMYEFLSKLVNLALPRVRDFRGISNKSFDKSGNYNLGIVDHLVFPEIDPTKSTKAKGLNITIVTTAIDDTQSKILLEELGFPFKR